MGVKADNFYVERKGIAIKGLIELYKHFSYKQFRKKQSCFFFLKSFIMLRLFCILLLYLVLRPWHWTSRNEDIGFPFSLTRGTYIFLVTASLIEKMALVKLFHVALELYFDLCFHGVCYLLYLNPTKISSRSLSFLAIL